MKQFFRFFAFGVFNTILGYVVIFSCLYLIRLSPETSNVIGYSVGLISSYALNKKYTFGSVQSERFEKLRFLLVFAFAYSLNFIALVILIHKINIDECVSQILAGIVYSLISYNMNKYYVFKDSISNNT